MLYSFLDKDLFKFKYLPTQVTVVGGDVAENQALKLLAVDDDIVIEFQAFSVISAVVPTTIGKNNSRGNNL